MPEGAFVEAGEALTAGTPSPHDLLRIRGLDVLQRHLVDEVQSVYRHRRVEIDDRHVEVIVAQMLRRVKVESAGDSGLLPGAVIDRHVFRTLNERLSNGVAARRPATCSPVLLGISRAAVQSASFISAASFQETTKVLTEAALAGRIDPLVGLKENVILGRLIPAGTGYPMQRRTPRTE